jgi:hypothetical protein
MQSASSGTTERIIARQVGIAEVGTNARVKNMANQNLYLLMFRAQIFIVRAIKKVKYILTLYTLVFLNFLSLIFLFKQN